jgi:hypothetical protein
MTAVSLPPRSELPRDVEIPVLPGLGLTWYDRGRKYWLRRAALAFMWGVVLLLTGLIDVGFYGAARHSSRVVFVILLAIDVAWAVAVLAYFAIRTARRWNVPSLPGRYRPVQIPRIGRGLTGALLTNLAQLGYWLALLAVAVLFGIFPGLLVALFLTYLMPEWPAERQARLWMAERLRERGILPAG